MIDNHIWNATTIEGNCYYFKTKLFLEFGKVIMPFSTNLKELKKLILPEFWRVIL